MFNLNSYNYPLRLLITDKVKGSFIKVLIRSQIYEIMSSSFNEISTNHILKRLKQMKFSIN